MADDPQSPEETERRLASLLKELGPSDFEFEAVPEDLWDAIEQEALAPEPTAGGGSVIALSSASRRRKPMGRRNRTAWLVAASVAALVGVGAVVAVRSGPAHTQVLAAAQLSNQGLSPAAAATRGTARLERDGKGQFIDLKLQDPPAVDDTYLEVWLIDRRVEGMVSLGPYHGNGRYNIPRGVDPASFPVVDISIEPLDGRPTHSGESAVRGVLA